MRNFYMGCILKASKQHANQQNESTGQMVARLRHWTGVLCDTNHGHLASFQVKQVPSPQAKGIHSHDVFRSTVTTQSSSCHCKHGQPWWLISLILTVSSVLSFLSFLLQSLLLCVHVWWGGEGEGEGQGEGKGEGRGRGRERSQRAS